MLDIPPSKLAGPPGKMCTSSCASLSEFHPTNLDPTNLETVVTCHARRRQYHFFKRLVVHELFFFVLLGCHETQFCILPFLEQFNVFLLYESISGLVEGCEIVGLPVISILRCQTQRFNPHAHRLLIA